jgi:hypothetical protein
MIRIDFANAVTISLIAFVAVFIINRALRSAGLSTWEA